MELHDLERTLNERIDELERSLEEQARINQQQQALLEEKARIAQEDAIAARAAVQHNTERLDMLWRIFKRYGLPGATSLVLLAFSFAGDEVGDRAVAEGRAQEIVLKVFQGVENAEVIASVFATIWVGGVAVNAKIKDDRREREGDRHD